MNLYYNYTVWLHLVLLYELQLHSSISGNFFLWICIYNSTVWLHLDLLYELQFHSSTLTNFGLWICIYNSTVWLHLPLLYELQFYSSTSIHFGLWICIYDSTARRQLIHCMILNLKVINRRLIVPLYEFIFTVPQLDTSSLRFMSLYFSSIRFVGFIYNSIVQHHSFHFKNLYLQFHSWTSALWQH